MDEDGQNWGEDVEDVHGALGEHQEHRHDHDDEVVGGDTDSTLV